MPLIQEPATKAPWPPKNGVACPVLKTGANGESFTQIAARKNVRKPSGEPDPWKVIEFNFATRNPKEVNWYLKTLFNCPTCPDGMNLMFKGGETIYLPPAPADQPPPPTLTEEDIKKLAEAFDIDPSEVMKFINQYNWTVDTALNTIGLLAEFGALGAASEIIGALTTVGGGILGFVFFFLWWQRLNQEDQIALGAFSGCYQFADWVVNPKARFANRSVRSPQPPNKWIKVNFVHVGPDTEVPKDKMWRFKELLEGWETGAAKMRENMEQVLRKGHEDLTAKLKKNANGKAVPEMSPERFEDLAKLFILRECAVIKRHPDAQGVAAANFLYAKLRPRVEETCNVKLLRKVLPYPGKDLDCEVAICE